MVSNLSEDYRKTLLDITVGHRQALLDVIEAKQKELSKLDAIVKELSSAIGEPPIEKKSSQIPSTYPIDQPWFLRIAYVIKEAGCFIGLGRIMEELKRHEPELGEAQRKTVSGTISGKAKDYDTIAMYKPKGSHGIYGLIDWTDDLGNPKPEYINTM